jgi:hypothetical protein
MNKNRYLWPERCRRTKRSPLTQSVSMSAPRDSIAVPSIKGLKVGVVSLFATFSRNRAIVGARNPPVSATVTPSLATISGSKNPHTHALLPVQEPKLETHHHDR